MVRTADQTKKTAILKAARRVFLKDGYASAKMSDIASEAGVAPGTLYLYFDSKESLASALGEDYYARLSSKLGNVMKNLRDPGGVETLVDWAIQIAGQERDLLVLTMAREYLREANSPLEARQRFVAELGEGLKEHIVSGEMRSYADANILADLMLAVIRRITMSYAVFGESNAEQMRAAAIKLLQHALFDDACHGDRQAAPNSAVANQTGIPRTRRMRK